MNERHMRQLDAELYYAIRENEPYYRERFLRSLLMISGTDSSVAKQEAPTTQQSIQEMAITAPSSLVLELGNQLEELDILINSLMKCRSNLLSSFNLVLAGVNGLLAQENLGSDNTHWHIPTRKVRDNPQA
jgi:hypothetical protein